MTRAPFFDRFERVKLDADQILAVPTEEQAGSPYSSYIESLSRNPFDTDLEEYRPRSLGGELDDADLTELHLLIERTKAGKKASADGFGHFALLNALAMAMGQILFVNNCVREGLPEQIAGYRGLLEQLANQISRISSGNGAELTRGEVRFFAALFVLQTAYDRLFVPQEPIGRYDYRSGEFSLSDGYQSCTAYLDLCAIREVEATAAERTLCENITTGWGDGISRQDWDRLNRAYYSGISPFTGRANLFATHYDELLERMLPQFPYAKVRLAQTVVGQMDPAKRCRVLEIGAGSGAFAIDLLMACKQRSFPSANLEYLGLEPSAFMIGNFEKNLMLKLGRSEALRGFQLREGSLELAQKQIDELVSPLPDVQNIGVFCFSVHHIYEPSLREFLSSRHVQDRLSSIYILDGTERHGWTKMYYMWADCESPENFRNVSASGIWKSETLWEEPSRPLPEYPDRVTNAWCRARRLQKESGIRSQESGRKGRAREADS